MLEGNLKAVMRLISALAAHYKPQSVKHHDVSGDNLPDKSDSHLHGKIRLVSCYLGIISIEY